MDPSAPFGDRVRRGRKDLGLTREQLASRVGCSVEMLRKIESGERRPSEELAEGLALQLGIAPEEREAFVRHARSASLRGGPAARGIGKRPPQGNLPAQTTLLFGRERELEEVRALLRREGVRLLTLTGPGGVGKTRLGMEAATGLLGDFEDGVCFVPLGAVAEAEQVAAHLAHHLGVKVAGGRALPAERLKEYLRPRRLLLVLDCFERVSGAASLVAELLAAAPGLKVLVTSRTALRISGERLYPLPPLPVPPPGEAHNARYLSLYPAVALFLDRANCADPGFALTEENAAEVAELCRALEGMPLAIELAGARSKLLSPRAMLGWPGGRLGLLTGGASDAPERHRTMRATLDWSYDLLGEIERRLLARLSVFAGGCTLEAAREACGEDGLSAPTPEVLAALLDSSLRRREQGAGGEWRFAMLDTVREYAAEKLEEQGDAEEVRERHAAYFLALAEEAEPHLTGPRQAERLATLEEEHPNLRAALRWALDHGRPETALRLAAALWRFWDIRGYRTEGRGWLEEALAATPLPGSSGLRARALAGAGMLASRQGDYARATELHEEALRLRHEAGDLAGIASSLNHLGLVALDQGRHTEAGELIRESLGAHRQVGDLWGEATALNNLGLLLLLEGDHRGALPLHRRSLELRGKLGDRRGVAMSLHNLGFAKLLSGELREAGEVLEQSLELRRGVGHPAGVAGSLGGLAMVALAEGRHEQAEELWGESLGMFEELGERLGAAECLEGLARAAALRGDVGRAAWLRADAVYAREAIGAPAPPLFRTLLWSRASVPDGMVTIEPFVDTVQ